MPLIPYHALRPISMSLVVMSGLAYSWKAPRRVDHQAADVHAPALAVNAKGAALSVWEQAEGSDPAGIPQVWANVRVPHAGGGHGSWSSAQVLSGPGGGTQPQVALNASDQGAAVWLQPSASGTQVWARTFGCGTWSAAAQLQTSDLPSTAPKIAVAPNGDAVAVWKEGSNSYGTIVASRYVSGGGWSAPVHLSGDGGPAGRDPQVVMWGKGHARVVWAAYFSPDGPEMNGRIMEATFAPSAGWSEAANIFTGGSSEQFERLRLSANSHGQAALAWIGSDVGIGGIWVARKNATGWTLLARNHNADTSGLPTGLHVSVALDGKEDVFVAWSESGYDDDTRGGTFVARYSGAAWDADLRLASAAEKVDVSPEIAVTPHGQAMVLWQQKTSATAATLQSRLFVSAHPELGWQAPTVVVAGVAGSMTNAAPLGLDHAGRALALWTSEESGVLHLLSASYDASH
jgi:hypothetical protein